MKNTHYELRPVRLVANTETTMEACRFIEATMFGVYHIAENGFADWVADFRIYEDAIKFRELKEA